MLWYECYSVIVFRAVAIAQWYTAIEAKLAPLWWPGDLGALTDRSTMSRICGLEWLDAVARF